MHKNKAGILHLIETTGPGGAEMVLVNITKKIDNARFESIVVVTGKGWLSKTLEQNNVNTLIIKSEKANDLKFLKRILGVIHNHSVDIIHSHLDGMNFYACLAGMLSGKPVIATYHGLIGDWDSKSFKNRIRHVLIRKGARFIVTVSDFLKRELARCWGFDERKMKTIYNGVDFAQFESALPQKSIRNELNIPEDSILVGMVGNIRPSKGYDIFIRAAEKVSQKRPECRFLIVGEGKGQLLEELRILANELKVADKVMFLGFRQDVASILSQLDLFVLSSTVEGLSIATIEAMGMKRPVVVTRSGGPEEIVEHGTTGFLVPPSNPSALAEHILKLLDNTDLARLMGERASKSVRGKFNIEKNIESYVTLYVECLKDRDLKS